jgi:alpha-beta hydrolase superfamily lysophospholipase
MDIIETVLKRKTLTFDGNKIVYWSNASPSTPALVFIHGFTCSSALWKDQLPLFKVYNTILIDLPGHGISEAPHVQYSLEYLARAVEAVLAEEEVAPSVLVGFSLGGPVSTSEWSVNMFRARNIDGISDSSLVLRKGCGIDIRRLFLSASRALHDRIREERFVEETRG